MRVSTAGNLIIPVLATAYALYMVWEQLAGSYRASTVNYALLSGGAVVLLSAAVIVKALMADRAGTASETTEPAIADPGQRERYVRGIAVFVLAALLVYFFEWIGYAIGFFVFSLATLRLLDVRSPALNVAIPIGTVLVVHFLFVNWLSLPLPAGLLRGIL